MIHGGGKDNKTTRDDHGTISYILSEIFRVGRTHTINPRALHPS